MSHWLIREHSLTVSHEWIDPYIAQDKRAGGQLHTHLRCQKKRRRPHGSAGLSQRGQIKGRVSIDERPAIVDERTRIGEWEADTVIGAYQGSQPVLVTVSERKSRYSLIIKAANKTAEEVKEKLLEIMVSLSAFVETISYDKGVRSLPCMKRYQRHWGPRDTLLTPIIPGSVD